MLPPEARTSAFHDSDSRDTALGDLRNWVQAELMPWRFFPPENQDFDKIVRQSVDEDPSVFRFTLHDGIVAFHEKPPEQYLAQLPSVDVYNNLRTRGFQYQVFLQAVVAAFGIVGNTELAIDLDDLADRTSAGPVFCFQKVSGARSILIPDVDMLEDFYLSAASDDGFAYDEKIDAAIFVGSTTGQLYITRTIVEQLAHQRLRSAVYFKDQPDVRFELPGIVQCDGPETEAMIRALGLGSVATSWAEQFSYRYLMSIDGNGATCSRVAIALKSNSVLMRYHSINDLYYFRGLQAWKHYVPLNRDADVIDNIALLRRSPALSREIAHASREFYRTRLSRVAVMRYMAELLNAYIARFGKPIAVAADDPIFAIDSFGHISGKGDVWSQPNGWLLAGDGGWIEGIGLIPGPEIAPSDLSYWAIDVDGTELDLVQPWTLAGSRGQSRALRGFRIDLHGDAAARFELRYEARFLDGTRSGPLPGGTVCVAASGSPLVALRLIVHRGGAVA